MEVSLDSHHLLLKGTVLWSHKTANGGMEINGDIWGAIVVEGAFILMLEIYMYRLQVKLESHGDEVSLLIRNVKTNPQSTVSAQPVLVLTKVRLWLKLK